MSPGVFPLQASFVKQAPDIFTQVTALCVGKDDARQPVCVAGVNPHTPRVEQCISWFLHSTTQQQK